MRTLVFVAAALIVVASASAGKSQFRFIVVDQQHDHVVEQQSPGWPTETPELWVTNPTACVWDVDDHVDYAAAQANLPAGASAAVSDCVIAESDQSSGVRHVAVLTTTRTPLLEVAITLGDAVVPVSPVARGREYDYGACLTVLPTSEAVISGSNGGVGQLIPVSVSISNPSGKQASVAAMVLIGNPGPNDPYGC